MSTVTDKPKRPRKLAVPVGADDHLLGPPDAPLTLVEYGDYQCRTCAAAKPVVDAVRAELGDELRFVFRHFPLRMHPHAENAAEAAEAAAAQGRFWAMHEQLSAHPDALDDEDLRAYARAAGLDVARFDADLRDRVHLERVRAQREGGMRSRVRRTPTFYVNGRRYDADVETRRLVAALRGDCF
jgi:protein-disulfide isomerase